MGKKCTEQTSAERHGCGHLSPDRAYVGQRRGRRCRRQLVGLLLLLLLLLLLMLLPRSGR